MLLAVDAGNTNVVFALVDSGQIRARWRIATDPRRTADEYAVWLSQLLSLEGYDRKDVTGRDQSAPSCRARSTISRCSAANISAPTR
jgi:pantothenate kinase type III